MHEQHIKVKGEKYPGPRVLPLSGSRFRPDMESVNVTREKNLVNMHEPRVKVKGEHIQKYPQPRVLPLSGSRFQPDIESLAVTQEKI